MPGMPAKRRRCGLPRVPLILCLLTFAPGAAVAGRSLDPIPAPPGFRIGIELELLPAKLANLMDYFDFVALKRASHVRQYLQGANRASLEATGKDLTADFLRDNPSALRLLPEDIQRKLTDKLNLQASNLITRRQGILNAAGVQATRQISGLIRPEASQSVMAPMGLMTPGATAFGPPPRPRQGLILPDGVAVRLSWHGAESPSGPAALSEGPGMDPRLFHESESGLTVTNNAAWSELNRRWEAIPEDQRLALVLPQLEKLGPLQKAFIAVWAGGTLRLRSDLSAKDRELFRHFSWSKDHDALELIHQEEDPSLFVHDPETFLEHARYLARAAGVEREVFDPESVRLASERGGLKKPPQWGSLHYHISRRGANLVELARRYNHLLLVRRINQGIVSDITGECDWRFNSSLYTRGLIRMHGKDEIEIRAHLEPLEQELREISGYLAMDPPKAAADLREKVAAAITSETLERVARHDPLFLVNLAEYLTPAKIRSAQQLLSEDRLTSIEAALAESIFKEGVPKEKLAILSLLNSSKPLRVETLRLLKDGAESPQGIIESQVLAGEFLRRTGQISKGDLATILARDLERLKSRGGWDLVSSEFQTICRVAHENEVVTPRILVELKAIGDEGSRARDENLRRRVSEQVNQWSAKLRAVEMAPEHGSILKCLQNQLL